MNFIRKPWPKGSSPRVWGIRRAVEPWMLTRGSSPRVWGIPDDENCEPFHFRFIPTRVGNTTPPAAAQFCRSVHPHACGEYALCMVLVTLSIGSSPRVWGIPAFAEAGTHPERFIPTRVGNTMVAVVVARVPSVHPHACGEYSRVSCIAVYRGGSSPRVWGIRMPGPSDEGRQRFIPTRVGNTVAVVVARVPSVHPHACGEYLQLRVRGLKKAGSSPRVWGIPYALFVPACPLRFIPTRVGNTPSLSGP